MTEPEPEGDGIAAWTLFRIAKAPAVLALLAILVSIVLAGGACLWLVALLVLAKCVLRSAREARRLLVWNGVAACMLVGSILVIWGFPKARPEGAIRLVHWNPSDLASEFAAEAARSLRALEPDVVVITDPGMPLARECSRVEVAARQRVARTARGRCPRGLRDGGNRLGCELSARVVVPRHRSHARACAVEGEALRDRRLRFREAPRAGRGPRARGVSPAPGRSWRGTPGSGGVTSSPSRPTAASRRSTATHRRRCRCRRRSWSARSEAPCRSCCRDRDASPRCRRPSGGSCPSRG
jgi:hypothetical protein